MANNMPGIMDRVSDLERRVDAIESFFEWFRIQFVRRIWGLVSVVMWIMHHVATHLNSQGVMAWFRQHFC